MRGRGWRGVGVDLGLYGLSAIFAVVTAASSTLAPHRAWGQISWYGYAAAFLATLALLGVRHHRDRARAAVAGLTWGAVAWLPLCLQAGQRAGGRADRAQEEVQVIEAGAGRLLDTGTPYLGRDAIAALPLDDRLLAYLPYQPGMVLFGLPRQLDPAAAWSDARVWFALVTALTLVVALGQLRSAGVDSAARIQALQVVTVLPVCALTLATGGDDLPVLCLCLLAVALAATGPLGAAGHAVGTAGRFGGAGLAVGAACALKLFAWPVALVLFVYACTRRAGWRFAAGAAGVPLLTLLPVLAVDPGAVVENVLRFPLGRGLVTSPAQSPLPGHLLATGVPGGRAVALGLLGVCVVAIAVWVVLRPPRTAFDASLRCGYGLLAATLLLPATRFGYLLYPAAFLVWGAAGYAVRPAGERTPSPAAATG